MAPHWNTRSNIRYFVHRSLEHNKDCDFRKVVPADKLEFAVLLQLVQTFGDQKRLEAAIEKATPDLSRVADLKEELAEMKKALTGTNKQKERLISAVAEGAIDMTDTKTRMDKLKVQEESRQSRHREVQFELDNIPDPELVKKSAKWATGVLKAAMKDSAPKLLLKRDYEWRRQLVMHSFTGVDNKGGALGIYVDYDKDGKFSYEIKGRFETTAKSLTLTKEEMIDAFGLDPQYNDIDKEIESIKSNFTSKEPGQHIH